MEGLLLTGPTPSSFVDYFPISPENEAKLRLDIFLGCGLNGSMRDPIEVTQQLNK